MRTAEAKLVQEDTFFRVKAANQSVPRHGELIQDETGPTQSNLVALHTFIDRRFRTPSRIYWRALGRRRTQKDAATVYVRGNVRIHLDRRILEVVLGEADKDFDAGVAMAEEWMEKLEIAEADLVAEAYVDLQKRTL